MNDIIDRLLCRYAMGPIMPNGEPEFGWRDFSGPAVEGMTLPTPIMREAAEAIRALLAERDHYATECEQQARLLGMSAERELKLIAERDALREAMEKLLAGARAEMVESWQCNSYHPKLIAGMDAAAALVQEQEQS